MLFTFGWTSCVQVIVWLRETMLSTHLLQILYHILQKPYWPGYLFIATYWKQKGSKCYWIKKQIELFHIHYQPSNYNNLVIMKTNFLFWTVVKHF